MRQFLLAKLSVISMLFEKANQEKTLNLRGDEALQNSRDTIDLNTTKIQEGIT